ncbi:hypothetical protein VTL71DRAFT_9231, partial [Oculimacula yallundae]
MTPVTRRLFCTLDDPLIAKAIWGKNSSHDPDSQQSYYDSHTETWHEISQSSMCEPKILSITVGIDAFGEWKSNWRENHIHFEHPKDTIGSDRWGNHFTWYWWTRIWG